MVKSKMNKEQLNATVSKWAKQKADEYGASDDFGNTSNFVESAILYYIGALDRERELKQNECEHELQTKYEECTKELQRLRDEHNKQSTMLIKLLSNHNDLIDEVNNLERSAHEGLNYTKRVTFE